VLIQVCACCGVWSISPLSHIFFPRQYVIVVVEIGVLDTLRKWEILSLWCACLSRYLHLTHSSFSFPIHRANLIFINYIVLVWLLRARRTLLAQFTQPVAPPASHTPVL
jgi:hypothetical protein